MSDKDQQKCVAELKPRVFGDEGNAIAWWSDDVQSALMNHPEIKAAYESAKEYP
jgi:hypothetical protein